MRGCPRVAVAARRNCGSGGGSGRAGRGSSQAGAGAGPVDIVEGGFEGDRAEDVPLRADEVGRRRKSEKDEGDQEEADNRACSQRE